MLVLQTLILIIGVYFAPAIAIRPKMAFHPAELAFAPFLSILLVFVAQTILSITGLYQPIVAQALTGLVVLIAASRLHKVSGEAPKESSWGGADRTILLTNLALCLFVGGRLLAHGFDSNDEIYSWNMWAVQHFFGDKIDYFYTQAPYPQFFPKVLSYCYMVLGGIEHQAAVKVGLVVFPFAALSIIGAAGDNKTQWYVSLHFILAAFLIFVLDFKSIFEVGMPDGLMASAVLTSALFLMKFWENEGEEKYLIYSSVCAVVAVLAKQPGLLWGLFSLPALLIVGVLQRRNSWKALVYALPPIITGVAWLLTEGQSFHDNEGVISRSFESRGMLDQIAYSTQEWLGGEPAVTLLLVLSIYVCFRAKSGLSLLIFFVVPSLLTWFLFASYDFRAGAAAIAVAALLIAHGNYGLRKKQTVIAGISASKTRRRIILGALFIICASGAAKSFINLKQNHNDYSVGRTDLNNLLVLYGDEAPLIHSLILTNRDVTLWTPTNYVYGVFYGRINVIRPGYHKGYNARALISDLRKYEPDFVTDSGKVPFGPGGKALNRLIKKVCPSMFNRIAGPDNKLRLSFYEIDKEILHSETCDL